MLSSALPVLLGDAEAPLPGSFAPLTRPGGSVSSSDLALCVHFEFGIFLFDFMDTIVSSGVKTLLPTRLTCPVWLAGEPSSHVVLALCGWMPFRALATLLFEPSGSVARQASLRRWLADTAEATPPHLEQKVSPLQ